MKAIDFNCDLGEGCDNDQFIMPYISSANIACGYHAGDDATIKKTIELCLEHNVEIGAHPGYNDKENFGRVEYDLDFNEYYDLIVQQLSILKKYADTFGRKIHHIKPHGALYNQAAKSIDISTAIVQAVNDFDKEIIIYGLSGSCLISEAKKLNLKTANEVFADRTYQDDGTLTSRKLPNALIYDEAISIQQVLTMTENQHVLSINNIPVPILADTICIHGDNENAAAFAKSIYNSLKENSIAIKAI